MTFLHFSCGKEEVCYSGYQSSSFKVVFIDGNSNSTINIDQNSLVIDNIRRDATYSTIPVIETNFAIQQDTINIKTHPAIVAYHIDYGDERLETINVILKEERVIDCEYSYTIQSIETESQSAVCEIGGEFLIKILI